MTDQQTISEDTNEKVGNGFASLQIVTTACHGVLNTQFIAPPQKPDWFDDLNTELDTAKTLATQWIDDLAPSMESSIPNHVIDYATTYKAMTDQIVELIDKDPTAKGKDNVTVQETFALIEALYDSVDDIIKEVQETQDQLRTWGDSMQKAHDDLFHGAANIQSAEADLQADISKMDEAMKGLQAKIDGENKVIASMGIAIAAGVFALVAGIALAPETGGYSLIVSGIGAAAIIGGGVTWGIMQNKINDQLEEIAADQKEKTDDQRQLVALKGLATAASMAINSVATATEALSLVRTMWSLFQGELQGTLHKLDAADEELMAIVNKGYILGAQKEWDLAVRFAEQLVGMKLEVQTKVVPMAA